MTEPTRPGSDHAVPTTTEEALALARVHRGMSAVESGLRHGVSAWGSPQRVFAPDVVKRVAPEDLPVGLRDTTARNVLVEVGLPVAEVGGLEITLPDNGGLPTTPWPSGERPSEAVGPFILIGRWWGGAVVIDGATGMVLRAQAEDEPESWSPERVTASNLHSFVKMLQLRKLASHFMAMAPCDPEQLDLRYQLEDGLAGIDKRGAGSPAWMRGLLHDSVW